MRAFKLLAVVYFVFTAFGVVLWRVSANSNQTEPFTVEVNIDSQNDAPTPQAWFNEMRPHCNVAEVEAQVRLTPAPMGDEGMGYTAACFAMAGQVDLARNLMERLPQASQSWAAQVIFGGIHGEADSGGEAGVAPAMELVLEYQPNNIMALYHAGSAAYSSGRVEAAREYLGRFVEHYGPEDGWKSNAHTMLKSLSAR